MYNRSTNYNAQSILVFRKWGRKGFSLFQTLKKVVLVSTLVVSYLVAVPLTAKAVEQDTSKVKMEYDLDEIEVSAQRTPALYSQVARIVSVVERTEIEAVPAQSIQDLLEYVAGVDVRQRGIEGVQADVSVRGGTFDQTLILLNGINITDPQTGHHNLNLPVSLNQIERIEILEGPAARVYGPNAFSGAINIVTRQAADNSLNLDASVGEFGYLNTGISGGVKTGKFFHSLAFNRKSSDGYVENTDFKNLNLFYSNRAETKSGKLFVQIGASNKQFGANSFYTPKFPNQFEEIKTLFSSAKWESHGKGHFTPAIYWRRHQDRFELFRSNPAAWYKSHNYHLTNVYGAGANSWFQNKLGKTAFGAEIRSENILSNVLGEALETPKPVPGEDAEFTKSKNRNIVSVFAEHNIYSGKLIFSAGVLANYISNYSKKINLFPGIDMSYLFTDRLRWIVSYNTSLRMPTFTDLYYAGPTNIGNPDLKPEKSATIETGLKGNFDFVRGQAVLFYRNGTDIIDWVKTSNEEKWQPQNLTNIKNTGAELSLQFLLSKKFGKAFPEMLSFSYLNNNIEKKEQNLISNYVLDNLKHKFVGAVNQKIIKNVTLAINATFQDREGTFTKFENGNYGSEVEYAPFWIFDGKLAYIKNGFSASVSVNNIFDTDYFDIGNVVQPGRWIKFGLAYQINFK